MKTKAEILSEKTGIDLPELEYKNEVQIIRPSEALEAMDEYAKQIAQEFAEWCAKNDWHYNKSENYKSENYWCKVFHTDYTTPDLFAKFMAERGDG